MTRTATTHVRRSVALAPSDWAALDAMAAQLGAGGRSGKPGVMGNSHPSWRALLREIARGGVTVDRPATVAGALAAGADGSTIAERT